MIQKVFEVGNSMVVTVPKKTGIKSGTKVKHTYTGNRLIYEIIGRYSPTPAESRIRETSGAFKVSVKGEKLVQILKSLKENCYDREIRFS